MKARKCSTQPLTEITSCCLHINQLSLFTNTRIKENTICNAVHVVKKDVENWIRLHHVICDSFEHAVSEPEQVENVTNVSTSLYVDQYGGSVLLQTATAEVVRPDNDSSPLNVRLVFDSCSQRSWRTCEIVQVGIKTLSDTTVYIQAFVVPVICGPLIKYSSELTRSSYEHLRDLPLADRAGGVVLAVSILILGPTTIGPWWKVL